MRRFTLSLVFSVSLAGCGPALGTLPRPATPSSEPAPQPPLGRQAPASAPASGAAASGPAPKPSVVLAELDAVLAALRPSLPAKVAERRLRSLIGQRRRVYLREQTAAGARCAEYRFSSGGDGESYFLWARRAPGTNERQGYEFGIFENRMWLRETAGDVVSGCLSRYLVVDVDKERISMFESGVLIEEYDPDKADVWFLSRAACEREGALARWGGCCGQ
jgi:hypothetical protein